LVDISIELAPVVLSALARARIAAYLDALQPPRAAATGGVGAAVGTAPSGSARRLYVASEERGDARTIVAAALRASSGAEPDPLPERPPDPLAGVDTDKAFQELIGDWHVDTLAAVREAERQLRREDTDWQLRINQPPADSPVWLDDEHYVPPPPPPLPRLEAPTIFAIILIGAAIALIAFGTELGLASDFSFLLGVAGILLGAGLLFMRLRERNDDDDDGAIL
jgi:hypothetical protein